MAETPASSSDSSLLDPIVSVEKEARVKNCDQRFTTALFLPPFFEAY